MTVSGLSNGTAYTFEVRAVNATGAGAASAAVTVTPADVVPGRPASPVAEAVGHVGVLITWQAPENAGSVITRYWLERQTKGSSTWNAVFNAGGDTFQYLHSNNVVRAGETYVYRVTAYNVVGGSSPSAASAEVTPLRADVAISESALEVPEGGSASYEVSLPVKPTAAVTVTASTSGDSDLSVSPTSLTFHDGRLVDDADGDGFRGSGCRRDERRVDDLAQRPRRRLRRQVGCHGDGDGAGRRVGACGSRRRRWWCGERQCDLRRGAAACAEPPG